MADGPVQRVRLRPLQARAYEYHGNADEVPAIEALLGAPVRRQANGDVVISCPAPRGEARGEARRSVLRPGMLVVRFEGPEYRMVVTDRAAAEFMYEDVSEEHERD